jgi:hypothetical protein
LSWFGEARALVELRRTRQALEDIAALIGQWQPETRRSVSLRTRYSKRMPDDVTILYEQTDEDFAALEKLEKDRAAAVGAGNVPLDDDLEEDWR